MISTDLSHNDTAESAGHDLWVVLSRKGGNGLVRMCHNDGKSPDFPGSVVSSG